MNWREALICLFLFGVAYWLWQKLDGDEDIIVSEENHAQDVTGYYLNDTELIRYDEQGQALYTINAERIEEDLATQSLKLSKLDIVYNTEDGAPWKITADVAHLPQDRKQMSFQGNVIAQQATGSNQASFRSDSLNYDIEKEILKTSDRVTARQGLQRITATGMTLNLKTERVKLHSNVKIRVQTP